MCLGVGLLTLADVRAQADLLLRRGYEGGVMIVTDVPSDRFVQFKKYIHRKGEFGLELGFPKAPWSLSYYDDVVTLVERQGIPFVLIRRGRIIMVGWGAGARSRARKRRLSGSPSREASCRPPRCGARTTKTVGVHLRGDGFKPRPPRADDPNGPACGD